MFCSKKSRRCGEEGYGSSISQGPAYRSALVEGDPAADRKRECNSYVGVTKVDRCSPKGMSVSTPRVDRLIVCDQTLSTVTSSLFVGNDDKRSSRW